MATAPAGSQVLLRLGQEWRRWGLGRRRVCGYSLIGLPGLHATDSLPKLVSQVQTGHMWVSTQFMTLSHPPIFTWHSPVGCTLPCRRQKLPGCDSGGHWRSGPVGLSVRRWAGIGIRRRPGQYTVWWAHGPPDRANRSSRELASPNRPSRSQDGGNDETASQSRKVQLYNCRAKLFYWMHSTCPHPQSTSLATGVNQFKERRSF